MPESHTRAQEALLLEVISAELGVKGDLLTGFSLEPRVHPSPGGHVYSTVELSFHGQPRASHKSKLRSIGFKRQYIFLVSSAFS